MSIVPIARSSRPTGILRRRVDAVPSSRVLVVASVDVKVRRVHRRGSRPVDEVVTLSKGDLLIRARTSTVVDDVLSLVRADAVGCMS